MYSSMLEVMYGVKANTLDEANALVQMVTGEISVGCESGNHGDYYRFGSYLAENIRVIQNEDMYDGETAVDGADDWKLVVILERSNPDSKYLAALDSAPTTFVKLKSETY
jgi:hypothetical protein